MIAIKIKGQQNFMAKFLATDTFESFLLEEAVIDTYNTFTIDGKVHREFFEDSDGASETEESPNTAAEFSPWSRIRSICLDLIKGKRTPLGFKFVLLLGEEGKLSLFKEKEIDISPEQVSFGIIIKFSAGEVQITTGISHKTFTMDKSAEKAWDAYIPSFLSLNGIDFELL